MFGRLEKKHTIKTSVNTQNQRGFLSTVVPSSGQKVYTSSALMKPGGSVFTQALEQKVNSVLISSAHVIPTIKA